MCIDVRMATINDIEIIFDIRTSVKENHLSKTQLTELGITEAAIFDLIENGSCVWVAEIRHQICGFAIADQNEGSVFALFIYPHFEAQGVGTVLLNTVETFLYQNFQEIYLETDQKSRAFGFYLHHGWRISQYLEGDDVRMMKTK